MSITSGILTRLEDMLSFDRHVVVFDDGSKARLRAADILLLELLPVNTEVSVLPTPAFSIFCPSLETKLCYFGLVS